MVGVERATSPGAADVKERNSGLNEGFRVLFISGRGFLSTREMRAGGVWGGGRGGAG